MTAGQPFTGFLGLPDGEDAASATPMAPIRTRRSWMRVLVRTARDGGDPAGAPNEGARAADIASRSALETCKEAAEKTSTIDVASPADASSIAVSDRADAHPPACSASTHYLMAPPRIPIQAHVEWRGTEADVSIGVPASALEHLAAIRTVIAEWVRSRGGVLGRLQCNGHSVDEASAGAGPATP
jgi:hypothetical protein